MKRAIYFLIVLPEKRRVGKKKSMREEGRRKRRFLPIKEKKGVLETCGGKRKEKRLSLSLPSLPRERGEKDHAKERGKKG